MIALRRRSTQAAPRSPVAPIAGARPDADRPSATYGPVFWLAYVSNSMFCVALALLYRYADFVTALGGTEFHLGWIVGVGMVGSLAMRLFLGSGIDRRGPRLIWLGSLTTFATVCFLHLAVNRYDGPEIYLLRIVFSSAVAGVFGASMTFISGRVPPARIAEMLGMLGTSGFMGMIVGSQIGDLLCGTQELTRWQIDRLFVVAGAVGLAGACFAWLAVRRLSPPPRRRAPPPLRWLLWRYQPGTILVVAVAAGAGLGMPQTFLRTYAAELSVPRIGLFFTAYSATAVVTRIVTRRWAERIGLTPMVLLGLGILSGSQLLFIGVRTEWMFVIPAVSYGLGHAILFPTMVATASQSFPGRYRGLGTMVALGAFDFGMLLGAPATGALLQYAGAVGLPRYPAMFRAMSAMFGLVGLFYALTYRPASRRRRRRPRLPHAAIPRPKHAAEEPAVATAG